MAETLTQENTWVAKHRFARIAPRKARLVMGHVRGMHCQQALDVLRFNPKRASGMITQVIKSAMANANEQEADMRRLYIAEARVDEGPAMMRWRPKDRGRAHPIEKRTSHLIVKVAEM